MRDGWGWWLKPGWWRKTTEDAAHQWDEPVSSAPCVEGSMGSKRGTTQNTEPPKWEATAAWWAAKPDGDERRVMRVRGLRLRKDCADNKRDLKGSTVNILLLFLEIIPDNSSSDLCRSKFCIFQCPSRFYYTLLSSCKVLQAARKITECVRLLVVY